MASLTPDLRQMLQVQMAGYRPPLTYRPSFSQQGLPPFTLWTVEWMKRDPQVRLGMAIKAAPFHKARLTIKADPEVSVFMSDQMKRFWQHGIPKVVRAFWYTLSGGEISYRQNEQTGRYEFWNYCDIYPADLSILHTVNGPSIEGSQTGGYAPGPSSSGSFSATLSAQNGNQPSIGGGIPVGISVRSSNPGLNFTSPTQASYSPNHAALIPTTHLFFPKGFLYIHNREFNSLIGRSELESAYDPWLEKNDYQGAKHSRKLWFYKNAFGGGILLHPPGNYKTATGEEVPYYDIARQAMETSLNGAVWCLENKTDAAGNQLWQYMEPSVRQGGKELLEYVGHLDNEILRGMGIPDDVVQQVSGTGSYAGRSVPLMAFFISHEDILDNLFNVIDEQVFRPLCRANFGHANYDATMDIDIESIMGAMDNGMGGGVAPQEMMQPQPGQYPPQQPGTFPQPGQPAQMSDETFHETFIRSDVRVMSIDEFGVPTSFEERDPLCPNLRVIHVRPRPHAVQFSWDEHSHVRAGAGRVTRNRSGKTSTGGQFADKIGTEGPHVSSPSVHPTAPISPTSAVPSPSTTQRAAGSSTGGLSSRPDPRDSLGPYGDMALRSPAHAHANRRSRILATLSANPYLQGYPGELEGLAELNEAAKSGDVQAGRLLSDIAYDSLSYLLEGVPGVELHYDRATGLYGGDLEASAGVWLEFPEDARKPVLAALAKFADNFNQHQIHVRGSAQPGTSTGDRYSDGSYNTRTFRFQLSEPMSRNEIEQVIQASGLYGLTSTDDYLEAYYVGPVNQPGQPNSDVKQFFDSIRKAHELLGNRVTGVTSGVQRLWAYGHGDGIPYGTIAGDVRPGTPHHNPTARRVAERLARRPVVPSEQAPKITPQQDALQTHIAALYEAMPLNDLDHPKVRKAYEELAKEVLQQYKALPIKVVAMGTDDEDPVEPYRNSLEMRTDVLQNNRLRIFKTRNETFGPAGVTYDDHPLLRDSGFRDSTRNEKYPQGIPLNYNDLLRAVHDYYAHSLSPVEFGPKGEEAAWRNHMAMTVSPWARWALTSETRGQNSWVNFGPYRDHNRSRKAKESGSTIFSEQKVGLLPIQYAKTGDPALDSELDEIGSDWNPEWSRNPSPIEPRLPPQLGHDPSVPIQFGVQHMKSGHQYVNPKTGKTIKGGQFTPQQGTPVQKPSGPAASAGGKSVGSPAKPDGPKTPKAPKPQKIPVAPIKPPMPVPAPPPAASSPVPAAGSVAVKTGSVPVISTPVEPESRPYAPDPRQKTLWPVPFEELNYLHLKSRAAQMTALADEIVTQSIKDGETLEIIRSFHDLPEEQQIEVQQFWIDEHISEFEESYYQEWRDNLRSELESELEDDDDFGRSVWESWLTETPGADPEWVNEFDYFQNGEISLRYDSDEFIEFMTPDRENSLQKFTGRKFVAELDRREESAEPPDNLWSEEAYQDAEAAWNDLSDEEQLEYAGEDREIELDWPRKFKITQNGRDYQLTRAISRLLQRRLTKRILQERGLWRHDSGQDESVAEELASDIWQDWKTSSTSPLGLLLQQAAADELGGFHQEFTAQQQTDIRNAAISIYNSYGETPADDESEKVAIGIKIVRAHVLATWTATQYIMQQADLETLPLYRGLILPGETVRQTKPVQISVPPEAPFLKYGPEEYWSLPDLILKKNGAASTAADDYGLSVANNWGGVGAKPKDPQRVVLRIDAPRESFLSVPAFGQNIHNEREVVLLGTFWRHWDAWLDKAPSVSRHPFPVSR